MNRYLEKIKNKKLWIIICIIGIVLMLIPPANNEKPKATDDSYQKTLTEQTEKLLCLLEGAGRVKVMISFSDKGQSYPVTDVTEEGNRIQEKTVSASGHIAVSRETYPSVRGVVVMCEGAENPSVRESIVHAVAALTGAMLHNICVLKMKP